MTGSNRLHSKSSSLKAPARRKEWRDLPHGHFGSWRTVWNRHRRYTDDGMWDKVLARLLANADDDGNPTGPCPWTPRSAVLTSTARTPHAPGGTHGACGMSLIPSQWKKSRNSTCQT
ncbi:transposase [Promicromonospora sp. NPDC050262]|uniref:transposase n=1 Tax=Promicromonospora sp. NPDC050262 TaxID=3155036 RepID=UPI0033D5990E